jgi:hypothetical protein
MNNILETFKTLIALWRGPSNKPLCYFSKFYFNIRDVVKKTELRNRHLDHYYFWLNMDRNTNEISIKRYNAQKNDKKRLNRRLKLLDLNINECVITSFGNPQTNGKWFKCVQKKLNISY